MINLKALLNLFYMIFSLFLRLHFLKVQSKTAKMNLRNFEFKARAEDLNKLEQKLLGLNPVFKGEDHQIDTYFNVPCGRLKLREGNIENALIYYERPDTADAKQSLIILYKHQPDTSLKEILVKVNGIKVVVDKRRKIYFIGNVKFHFDIVSELGTFVEVEVIDETGQISAEELQKQCNRYFSFLNLNTDDYISKSYSDLILDKLDQ
jgi:predicted adenylyl cyclase CyaB